MEWADKIRAKVSRLLGVVGRAGTVMGGQVLSMLYNSLVLPHLQYCPMAWGDFQSNRNMTLAESLPKLQKRFVGVIAGKQGKYHSDPIFADLGILNIGDLYRQQLRIHAWKFWNGRLPESQEYNTTKAKMGLTIKTQDHSSIGNRAPKEWDSMTETLRGLKSLFGFKGHSKQEFLKGYKAFECTVKGCFVCKEGAVTGIATRKLNSRKQRVKYLLCCGGPWACLRPSANYMGG